MFKEIESEQGQYALEEIPGTDSCHQSDAGKGRASVNIAASFFPVGFAVMAIYRVQRVRDRCVYAIILYSRSNCGTIAGRPLR